MKKIISVMMLVVLAVMLCSCGKTEKPATSTEAGNVSNTETDTKAEVETEAETEAQEGFDISKIDSPVELSEVYQIPGYNVVVNVPFYMDLEKGFSKLFMLFGERCIAVSINTHETPDNLDNAHLSIMNYFKQTFENYADIQNLRVDYGEYKTVNGIETYYYEGVFECKTYSIEYELPVTGYSFIMDEHPCCILGIVMDEEDPSDELIQEVKDTTIAVASTLRSER